MRPDEEPGRTWKPFSRAGLAAALLLVPLTIGACQTPAPDDGVQVWVSNWPGSTTPEKAEAILLRGADIRCGIGDAGELCFVPAQAANRIEFPDGSTMEAEGIKLYLKRTEENGAVGTGPYSMELLLLGDVKLNGPFTGKMEAWLGSTPEKGEALPLVSGTQKGPLSIRCPVTLTSLIANGHGMIFGSLKKPGVMPGEEVPKEGEAGAGETPPPAEGEGEPAPGEGSGESAGEGTGEKPAEEGPGETPAGEGEGEAKPGEEGEKPAEEESGEKPAEGGSGG